MSSSYRGPPEVRKSRHERAMDGIDAKLRNYDRTPFLDLLAAYLDAFPSAEALEAFAEKYPDRYVTALGHIARVAGYTDKTESSINVNINVRAMSDSQLEDRLKQLAKQVEVPATVLDLEAVEVSPHEDEGD
jgi:hypothetical protein